MKFVKKLKKKKLWQDPSQAIWTLTIEIGVKSSEYKVLNEKLDYLS